MRQELLASLICPACEDASWQLEGEQSPGIDVVHRGCLVCTSCGGRYTIRNGVLDLLPQPDDVILRERAGWTRFLERSPQELDDNWLLALPRIDERVASSADSIAHWKRQADNFESLIQHLDLSGEERVLELGAGRCWASAYLSRRGCEVVALDVVGAEEAGGLEAGAAYLDHGAPYFERLLASMEKLPFRQGTFDVLLSVASIHHTVALHEVVGECARVLKPGGRLALTSEPCIRVLKKRRVQNLETELGINENVYNILDYSRAFGDAGLRTSFYLPGALTAMLREERIAMKVGRLKQGLFNLAGRMWRRRPVRSLLHSQPVNLLGLLFLEYGLTAIAQKEADSRAE